VECAQVARFWSLSFVVGNFRVMGESAHGEQKTGGRASIGWRVGKVAQVQKLVFGGGVMPACRLGLVFPSIADEL